MKGFLEFKDYRTRPTYDPISKKFIKRQEEFFGVDTKAGITISAVSELVARLLVLGYESPCRAVLRKQTTNSEDGLEGRNPNW